MGFQSGLNQTLGAVAGAAFAISDAKAKDEAKQEKAAEAKVNLAKEDAALAQAEYDIKDEKAAAEKATKEAEDVLNKVSPNAKGQYRNEQGKYMTKASGQERQATAALELQKRQEALGVVLKKEQAITIQRADWKRRIGGLK